MTQQQNQTRHGSETLPEFSQQDIVTLLAHSDQHGKLVASMVEAELFTGLFRPIAVGCIEYWREYKRAPKNHLPNLLTDELEKPGRSNTALVNLLMQMHELGNAPADRSINAEFVTKSLQEFKRNQLLKDGVIRSAEAAASHKSSDQLADLLRQTVARDAQTARFDGGIMINDLKYFAANLAAQQHDEFALGIPLIDHRHAAPARGKVAVLIAITGHGKSWWLVHVGRQAMRSKKVLHITLELSAAEVQQRYFQSLLAVPLYEDQCRSFSTLLRVQNELLIGFDRREVRAGFALHSANAPSKIKQEINRRPGAYDNLRIKEFAARSLSLGQLQAYLDQMAAIGFEPDVLLLDYADLMATNASNKDYRIELGRLYAELRGLAAERKLALVTAQQANREAVKAKQVGLDHVAEDWSITGTADFVYTLSRSAAEHARKLVRLHVGKVRHGGRDEFTMVLTQNYDHGQFVLDSAAMPALDTYAGMLGD